MLKAKDNLLEWTIFPSGCFKLTAAVSSRSRRTISNCAIRNYTKSVKKISILL